MGWGGPGGGGAMFGASASSASGRAGLPFGGIPEELMEEATKLLATEPVHPKSHVHFTQRPSAKERERLTLPQLLRAYPKWVVAGSSARHRHQSHAAGRTAPHRVRHQSRHGAPQEPEP